MNNFANIVQKTFFLGVGIAAYAGEKAGSTLAELREQAQELVDEMVSRGEMTTEEARRWVEETTQVANRPPAEPPAEPRRIEILTEDDLDSPPQ